MEDIASWQYLDSSKQIRGPYRASTILAWHSLCSEHGFNNGLQVRSIKWTDMSWKPLADAHAELRAQCGQPPGFSLPGQPKSDAFAMFDAVPQPARNWFYVTDDSVMGPLQPSEMKSWATGAPDAMSTHVFCVTPDVPEAWAKKMEVATALAATLAEHLDAAENGNAVAPWDLQEVRESMIEHGYERELAAPGGSQSQGRGAHASPASSGRQGVRGRRSQGPPGGRGGFAGSDSAARGGRGRRGVRGRHVDHSPDRHPPGHHHHMLPEHSAAQHLRDAAGSREFQQQLMGMAAAVPTWDGQQMRMGAPGAARGMMHDPGSHGPAGHAYMMPGRGHGGQYGHGGLVAVPAALAAHVAGRGHAAIPGAAALPADVQALAHNPRAEAMMQALAELHPSRPQFLRDHRERQAPPPQGRAQHAAPQHTFHPRGPAMPDMRGQRPPLPAGWHGLSPPGAGADLAAVAAQHEQGGRGTDAMGARSGSGDSGAARPQGDGAPQATAEHDAKAADEPPTWPNEGFSALQARGVTKTPSGSFVFDGPSWASLAIEDPDPSSS